MAESFARSLGAHSRQKGAYLGKYICTNFVSCKHIFDSELQTKTFEKNSAQKSLYFRLKNPKYDKNQNQIEISKEFLSKTFKKYIIKMNRRKSVFAESYNPDEDDDERIVNPKSNQERATLGEVLSDIILFKSLENEQMSEVLDAMFEKKVYPGDYIIRQGDDADNFYVIQSGTYKVFVDNVCVKTYDGTGCFGELALMYNTPRQATVQSVTAGTLWALDRKTFRRIILKSAVNRRKLFEKLLNSVPMLASLKYSERMNLADALVTKYFNIGERIFEKGEKSNGMYFIEEGEVSIRVYTSDDGELEINRLKKGDYFGELSLITNKPRAASAAVVQSCKLAFLDVETFERLLGPCREIMKRNIDQYETTLIEMFGGKDKITDIR